MPSFSFDLSQTGIEIYIYIYIYIYEKSITLPEFVMKIICHAATGSS